MRRSSSALRSSSVEGGERGSCGVGEVLRRRTTACREEDEEEKDEEVTTAARLRGTRPGPPGVHGAGKECRLWRRPSRRRPPQARPQRGSIHPSGSSGRGAPFARRTLRRRRARRANQSINESTPFVNGGADAATTATRAVAARWRRWARTRRRQGRRQTQQSSGASARSHPVSGREWPQQ